MRERGWRGGWRGCRYKRGWGGMLMGKEKGRLEGEFGDLIF